MRAQGAACYCFQNMAEYDFISTVREDLVQLGKELAKPGVSESIDSLASKFGVNREQMLAALWRSAKRHGEILSTFVTELSDQSERETARASGA